MEYNKNNTSRRPKEVTDLHFQSEWDRIFGKKEDKEEIRTGVLEVDPVLKEKIDKIY